MFKFLALTVILAVVVSVHAFPAVEDENKPSQNPLPANEADLAAGEGDDLKPAETFGFGYYPSYGYGRGYGGYGGWRYSGGYGRWGGGYRRGWGGYGGYPNGYYW